MCKNLVIVTEKVNHSQFIATFATKLFPNCNVHFIQILSIGLYDFKYPRHLKMRDFPVVKAVEWKLRYEEIGFGNRVFLLVNNGLKPTHLSIEETLKTADEIVCALVPERTLIHSFKTLILNSCGKDKYHSKMRAIPINLLSEKSITQAFLSECSTEDEWFVDLYKQAKVRKYFDYNFNLNSAAIMGRALAKVGVDQGRFILSKNSLIVMYYLRQVGQIGHIDFLKIMNGNWSGTGKYQKGSIGSIASQSTILEQLNEVGLICGLYDDIKLSEKGESLLAELHPDCCDLDLTFRLDAWMEEGERSQPQIDRYIKTMFGKQKRFFSKNQMTC